MRRLSNVLVTLLVIAAIGAGGLYLYQRHAKKKGVPMRKVEIPGTDFHVELPRVMGPEGVSTTIYLNREGAWLVAGADEAPRNRSSIVKNAGLEQVKIPPFTGSYSGWKAIVRCIRKQFQPFNVEVVDSRPVDRDFIMAVIGGRADLVGHKASSKKRFCAGLSPFSGGSIRSAVVLVFSQALRNNTRSVCEVAGQEIGHAYGLDHSYNCRDLMTYLKRCTRSRTFVDKDVPCGEYKPRLCKPGDPRQNTYQHLLRLLGPRPKQPEPSARARPKPRARRK
jgi:hypothetical protein